MDAAHRDYALTGAAAGAIVATTYGALLGSVWWFAVGCELIGIALGAALGVVTGDGSVKEAWAGRVGAFVIPLIALALAALVVTVVVGAHGQ